MYIVCQLALHTIYRSICIVTHSSTLAWKIPWTEQPGRLQSMGLLRAGHDWATSLSLFTFMHWRRKWQPIPVFLPGESQGQGAWWAAIYGVAQSWTRLKWLSSSSSSSLYCKHRRIETDYALDLTINFLELNIVSYSSTRSNHAFVISSPDCWSRLNYWDIYSNDSFLLTTVGNLTEVVPQLLDQLRTVEQKRPASNVSASIQRIRELIAQTRSVASKVTSEESLSVTQW